MDCPGYEYALSVSRCVSIQAIDPESREAVKVDSRISMRPLSELLLNVSSWQTYDKVGRSHFFFHRLIYSRLGIR